MLCGGDGKVSEYWIVEVERFRRSIKVSLLPFMNPSSKNDARSALMFSVSCKRGRRKKQENPELGNEEMEIGNDPPRETEKRDIGKPEMENWK